MIVRLLPIFSVILFFGVGFVWRAWLQYRRYGSTGVILFHSTHWRQRLRDSLFMVLLLATAVQAATVAIWPEAIRNMSIVPAPTDGMGLWLGGIFVFGGIILTLVAQLQLGASWRVGIEEGARPGLVNRGLYSMCRNPIFLGMFISMAGLMILLPTWVSLAIVIGSIACVRSQVQEEETYLLATYQEEYRSYSRRVGRFLPVLGRLN